MADDIEKTNQLVKAKTSSLQKRASNIISRGLSDLALLDVNERKITDEERLLQARELLKKGYEYHINGDYDKAIEAYTSAIALNPNDDFLWFLFIERACVYRVDKGQYDMAIEDYNKAIALDPNGHDLSDLYYIRGVTYEMNGQYDKAIDDYNKEIALNPNRAYAYNSRGVVYEMLENKSMAISDYRKACDLGDELGCENLQRVLREK